MHEIIKNTEKNTIENGTVSLINVSLSINCLVATYSLKKFKAFKDLYNIYEDTSNIKK